MIIRQNPTLDQPLVSIGLPTYNRAASLGRAIESVLTQDYQNIELVISDNASTDETEIVCREFSRRDPRIKYLRQPTNQGATANFREVLKHASGAFYMWLADDDWLDRSYISLCMEVLTQEPDHALVCGAAKYFQNENLAYQGEIIQLPQPSGEERVLAYYQKVSNNGTFYGVMRREHLRLTGIPNVLGGDWLLVAAMAFLGKVETITSSSISRSLGGLSRDMRSITRELGVSDLHARVPRLSIAVAAFKDIGWKSSAYDSLGRSARLSLAWKVFFVFWRRHFKPYWWDLLYPYWAPPILFALSVKKKVRKKMLGPR